MVKCPKGTAEQIDANVAYLRSLHERPGPTRGPDDAKPESEQFAEEATYRSICPHLDVVRADKRSPPTTEDEITYLFINHFLDILLKCWDGMPCVKPKRTPSEHATREEYPGEDNAYNVSEEYLTDLYKTKSQKVLGESKEERASVEDTLSAFCRESRKSSASNEPEANGNEDEAEEGSLPSWKMVVPDEDVYMSLQNGAWYKGRVSRRLMDGDGVFFWEDGASFQGEFKSGTATGFGRLEFPDLGVYEGGVYKGFRHGEGLHCMHESPVMYSGQWWMGKKHGEGLIFYSDPIHSLNFYKGSWVNGVKEGFGWRQYGSGCKYLGYWRNGKRHGTGIMFWSNNDIYRGEWKNGLMDGYGEYVWRSSVNKTFSCVRANTYRGYWANGKRNGVGLLELINGSIIETVWVDNEKHGPGAVVCPNGTIILSAQKIFTKDKPARVNESEENLLGQLFRNQSYQLNRRKSTKKELIGLQDQTQVMAYISSMEKANTISIPIHTPVHSLDLSCHTMRLKEQKDEMLQKQQEQITIIGPNNTPRVESVGETKIASSEAINQSEEVFSWEEKLLRYCVMVNLSNLKVCYEETAKMACDAKLPFQCTLLRLFFWELLTQAGVPTRNLSLTDIDNILAREASFLIDFPHDPFEKIQLWQFIHFLITISWYMYGRYVFEEDASCESEEVKAFLEEFYNQSEKAVLSSAFSYFLRNHIYASREPAKNSIKNWDLLPMKAMYLSYKSIGEPHSAKEFLIEMCRKKKESAVASANEKMVDLKERGKNVFTVVNELSYLTAEERFNHPDKVFMAAGKEGDANEDVNYFDNLKEKDIVNCLIQACPNIVEDGLIVDMEHQLTFLEYYKAITSCAAVSLKKHKLKQIQSEILSSYRKELEEYERQMKEYEKRKESVTSVTKKTSQSRRHKKNYI